MILYFYLYCISAILVFFEKKIKFKENNFILIIFFLLLVFLIGFRFQVGGDWENYSVAYSKFSGMKFLDIFKNSMTDDILFDTVQWISYNLFDSIYFANIFCAFIFVSGLNQVLLFLSENL